MCVLFSELTEWFVLPFQIYIDGKFSHFVDGSDENTSSWMRFIRCARNRNEQNMAAYQCGQNIYYRSFRDIALGEELLVWYSDSYQKHLEIPLSLKESDQAKIEGKPPLHSLWRVVHPFSNHFIFCRTCLQLH